MSEIIARSSSQSPPARSNIDNAIMDSDSISGSNKYPFSDELRAKQIVINQLFESLNTIEQYTSDTLGNMRLLLASLIDLGQDLFIHHNEFLDFENVAIIRYMLDNPEFPKEISDLANEIMLCMSPPELCNQVNHHSTNHSNPGPPPPHLPHNETIIDENNNLPTEYFEIIRLLQSSEYKGDNFTHRVINLLLDLFPEISGNQHTLSSLVDTVDTAINIMGISIPIPNLDKSDILGKILHILIQFPVFKNHINATQTNEEGPKDNQPTNSSTLFSDNMPNDFDSNSGKSCFTYQSLSLKDKTVEITRSFSQIIHEFPVKEWTTYYKDIVFYFVRKFDISHVIFDTRIIPALAPHIRSKWLQITSSYARYGKTYASIQNNFSASKVLIKPLAPTGQTFQTISGSSLCKHESHFETNLPSYYIVANDDPFYVNDHFSYHIILVLKASLVLRISHEQLSSSSVNSDMMDPESSSSDNRTSHLPDVYNTLVLNQIEDTWYSQPFDVNLHDSVKWIQLNLSSRDEPVIISVDEVMNLLSLPLGKSTHGPPSIPHPPLLNRLQEKEDTRSYLRIPVTDSSNIFKFFQEVSAIGGKPIDYLDTTAKFEFTQILSTLCNNFTQAILAFNKDDTPVNAATLDTALTQWTVIPTFLLLFPVSNWRNIKEKKHLHVFIKQRYEAICTGFKNGDKHVLVEVKHLADKKITPQKAGMTYKAAEGKVIQRKYATATDMLLNSKKKGIGTSTLNDQTTFTSLLALHPSSITRTIDNPEVEDQSSSMSSENQSSPSFLFEEIFAAEEFKTFAGKVPSEVHNNILKNKSYFTEENVQKAFVANARKGTSPGVDKLSAQFIYNLIQSPDGASKLLLRSIISLFNSWITAPSYIWQFITVASINGLPKPDNGVRPIANGCQWRKIWTSILLQNFRSQIQSAYGDTQLSGSPYAAEKFTTRANILFHDLPDHLLFKFDIKNAFNSFLRTAAFEQLIEDIPELGHILIRLFNQELTLLFKDTHFIKSVLGSQQGCIFGPLMFNMAFKRVLSKVNQQCPYARFNAYMDDNLLFMENNHILAEKVINVFKYECKQIGLEINFRKSSAIVPMSSGPLVTTLVDLGFDPKNLKSRTDDPSIPVGLEVLGCPIGNDSFINNFLIIKFDEYCSLCKAISNLPHLICQWSLARNSVFCKLIYILRCVAPEYTNNHISCIEDAEWGIIEELAKFKDLDFINTETIEELRSRCSKIKIDKGGLGLKDYRTISNAAYLGAQVSIFDDTLVFIKKYTPDTMLQSKWLDKLTSYVHDTNEIISPFLDTLPLSPRGDNIVDSGVQLSADKDNCLSPISSSSSEPLNNMSQHQTGSSSTSFSNMARMPTRAHNVPLSIRHCYVKACHNFQSHWRGPSCFDRNAIEYNFVKELGNGSCLFSAMSRAVFGTPWCQMVIRHRIADHLREHQEFFLTKYTVDMCGPNHYNNVTKDREFGTLVDIEAFARVYNMNVIMIIGTTNKFEDINIPQTWNSQFSGQSREDFPPHSRHPEDGSWNCYLCIGNSTLPTLYNNETGYLFVRKTPDHYDTLVPCCTIPHSFRPSSSGLRNQALEEVPKAVPFRDQENKKPYIRRVLDSLEHKDAAVFSQSLPPLPAQIDKYSPLGSRISAIISDWYVKAQYPDQLTLIGSPYIDNHGRRFNIVSDDDNSNGLFGALTRACYGESVNMLRSIRETISQLFLDQYYLVQTKFAPILDHVNTHRTEQVLASNQCAGLIEIIAFSLLHNFNIVIIADIKDLDQLNDNSNRNPNDRNIPYQQPNTDEPMARLWNQLLHTTDNSYVIPAQVVNDETRFLFLLKRGLHYDMLVPTHYPLASSFPFDIIDNSSSTDPISINNDMASSNSNVLVTSKPHSPSLESSKSDRQFNIGDRVWISFNVQEDKTGIIAFLGNVRDKSNFAGIILDEPTGKNNGTIDGIRYFTCKENHGIFASLDRIIPFKEKPLPNNSPNIQTTIPVTSGSIRTFPIIVGSTLSDDDEEEEFSGHNRCRANVKGTKSMVIVTQAGPLSQDISGMSRHVPLDLDSGESSDHISMNMSNSSPECKNSENNISDSSGLDDSHNLNLDISDEILLETNRADTSYATTDLNNIFAEYQEESIKAIRNFKLRITPKADKIESQWNPFKFQSIISKLLFEIKFPSKGLPNNYATNWLLTQPSSARRAVKHSEIKNEIFTRMWRSTLHIDLAPSHLNRKCVCGASLDSKETHLKQCANMQIKNRHDNLVGLLVEFYSTINGQPYKGEVSINSIVSIPNVQHQDFLDTNREMQAALNVPFPKPISDDDIDGITNIDNIREVHMRDEIQDLKQSKPNSACNKPAECPIINNQPSGPDRLIYTPASASSSTKGTRVDLITMSPNIKVFIDVCISNPKTHHFEQDYLKITNSKLSSAENKKNKLHKSKVVAGGFEYLAAIFSTDGNPSINTKTALKYHQQKYLDSMEANAFNKTEYNGSILNYFLNLISFQINFDNAAAALLLPIKLHLKHPVNSTHGETTEALRIDRILSDQINRQNKF